MSERSPVEGVVRQLRKAVDDHRHNDSQRIAQELSDIKGIVETAEELQLRTPVLDLMVHEKLASVLDSIGQPTPRTRPRLTRFKRRYARAALPLGDADGQLALPLGDDPRTHTANVAREED